MPPAIPFEAYYQILLQSLLIKVFVAADYFSQLRPLVFFFKKKYWKHVNRQLIIRYTVP